MGPFEPRGAGADLQLTPAPGLTTTEVRNAAKQGLGCCTKVKCMLGNIYFAPPSLTLMIHDAFFFSPPRQAVSKKDSFFNSLPPPPRPACPPNPRPSPVAPQLQRMFCIQANGTVERQHVLLSRSVWRAVARQPGGGREV